jgi:hypothetical protein
MPRRPKVTLPLTDDDALERAISAHYTAGEWQHVLRTMNAAVRVMADLRQRLPQELLDRLTERMISTDALSDRAHETLNWFAVSLAGGPDQRAILQLVKSDRKKG